MSDNAVVDRPADAPPESRKDSPKPERPQADRPPQEPDSGRTRRRRPGRLVILAAALCVILIGGGWLGAQYWTTWQYQVSTDDAYVEADNVTVAPRVSGYIGEVLVADNQPVKAGDVLARIDDRDYRAALDQAQAQAEAAQANTAATRSQLDQQRAAIEQAKATVAIDQANLTFAQKDYQRYTDLARRGNGSEQSAQDATARVQSADATLRRDQAAVVSADAELKTLEADLTQAEATVQQRQAELDQAKLNLGYTTITAPTDGVVGNRALRVGQYVEPGTQLMAVVPVQAAYVVANYKETQLTDVRPGQPVDIEVDMFPDVVVHGHVDSLSPASGQAFALLPPDNATGNFTKIVQRVPVKIVVPPDNPLAGQLRPGMSVIPTIDIRGERAGQAQAQTVQATR
ncbi:HlyD family secretion protein [Marinivivus vitaminiproducens]|uniref:HlyD family secretion protein n=1 Tax=Marinivivus vitaminiproducens TaxID=3035935 RepID=UPI0027A7214D|nr:HlyD family secretion protein [Geminicoccaceae bacterium SCSIO 64248]